MFKHKVVNFLPAIRGSSLYLGVQLQDILLDDVRCYKITCCGLVFVAQLASIPVSICGSNTRAGCAHGGLCSL